MYMVLGDSTLGWSKLTRKRFNMYEFTGRGRHQMLLHTKRIKIMFGKEVPFFTRRL
jgi:hypothetical protein